LPEIHLHIGAHKTASSHLQRSLRQNRKLLRAHGVAFLPTGQYRKTLAPLQIQLRDGAALRDLQAQAAPLLEGAAGACGRLVLSDENILGQLPRVAKGADLYPWATGRVQRSMAVLPTERLHLFLAIRNVARFLPSAYGESLRHGRYQTFERFISNIEPARLRWSRLVQRLRQELEDAPITVWRIEDYSKSAEPAASALIGRDLPPGFSFIKRRLRPGLSELAQRTLAKWAAEGRAVQAEKLLDEAARLYPGPPANPPFRPIPAELQKVCDRNYADDAEVIAGIAGVTLLESRR
jgi:hypothetical protein